MASTVYHRSLRRGSSDTKDENEGFSRRVADLVRLVTQAHRAGMGEIIWVGWQPEKAKPSRLRCGTHLVMLTKYGMMEFGLAYQTGAIVRDHIDRQLKQWLIRDGVCQAVQACYTYPTLGSFWTHESGCCPQDYGPGTGGRKSGF